MIGMKANSSPVVLIDPADSVMFDGDPVPAVNPNAIKTTSADVNQRGDDDDGAGGERMNREGHGIAGAGNRDGKQRRVVGNAGDETIERDNQKDRAGGQCATETGDERCPAGEKAGQRSERFAKIDVLATCLRPQRRELGIGHGAHERQHAAAGPGQEKPGRIRDCGGYGG